MNRMTACWHFEAEKQLAEIWLKSGRRDLVTTSIAAIERELRTNPAGKGLAYGLSALSAVEIDSLRHQLRAVPEDLQRMSRGILDVFFVVRKPDCMVTVYIVRERTL